MTTVATGRAGSLGAWLLGAGACFAMGAAVMSSGVTTGRVDATMPVETSDIADGIDSLRPNCRMIARHRLKTRLDATTRGALTTSDLDQVLGPLRRGGSDLCEAITGQSFALGGS